MVAILPHDLIHISQNEEKISNHYKRGRVRSSTMEHLTNNGCEGGNLIMKNRSKGSHIGMYRFMTVF